MIDIDANGPAWSLHWHDLHAGVASGTRSVTSVARGRRSGTGRRGGHAWSCAAAPLAASDVRAGAVAGRPVPRHPARDGGERFGSQPVHAPGPVASRANETGGAEDVQVLADRRSAHVEVGGELRHGSAARPQAVEDRPASRMCQGVEDVGARMRARHGRGREGVLARGREERRPGSSAGSRRGRLGVSIAAPSPARSRRCHGWHLAVVNGGFGGTNGMRGPPACGWCACRCISERGSAARRTGFAERRPAGVSLTTWERLPAVRAARDGRRGDGADRPAPATLPSR